jgi:hypothetical protein
MNGSSETIKIVERRFNAFPAKFNWRGSLYRVEAVNECKTVADKYGALTGFHYWVRCDGRLYHLEEALPSGQWSVHCE